MSKIEDLLRQKRAAQIRRMEGHPDSDAEAEVDRALQEVRKHPKEKRPKRKKIQNKKINITPHAQQRMAQRGMNLEDVHAIWRSGESHTQSDGRMAYTVTREAIEAAIPEDRVILESWLRCAVVVEERTRTPVLITILASGEDTKTYSGWSKRPNMRRKS